MFDLPVWRKACAQVSELWQVSQGRLTCALQVLAYPSKSDGMFVSESLIFRSDSNGEDLAGYAGAGLYDSITMDPTVTRKVDYGADKCAPGQKSYII